jgi:PEGA domain
MNAQEIVRKSQRVSLIKKYLLLFCFTLSSCAFRNSEYVEVLVNSSPAGSKVVVNQKYYGVTPVTVSLIPQGNYEVQITKEGYRDYGFVLQSKFGPRLAPGDRFRCMFDVMTSFLIIPAISVYSNKCRDFSYRDHKVYLQKDQDLAKAKTRSGVAKDGEKETAKDSGIEYEVAKSAEPVDNSNSIAVNGDSIQSSSDIFFGLKPKGEVVSANQKPVSANQKPVSANQKPVLTSQGKANSELVIFNLGSEDQSKRKLPNESKRIASPSIKSGANAGPSDKKEVKNSGVDKAVSVKALPVKSDEIQAKNPEKFRS